MITVIGHKAPDTDATCSPIAYAWYLNKIGKKAQAFISGEFNRETKFVLEHFNIETPDTKEKFLDDEEVIVLDTNNPDELLDNYGNAKVIEIIDHHKLAGLKTDSPLKVTMDTVGCTATLVFQKIKSEQLDLDSDIAGILLSAILSDTLKFTSPTTTQKDQDAANDLAGIADVDIEELAKKMFDAKSDLTGMGAKEILLSDSKVFEMVDKKVRVSVHETTNTANAKAMKNDFISSMNKIKSSEGLDAMFFFVIDILSSNAEILTETDEEKAIASKAFDIKYEDFSLLEGVVSRKKQIVPKLEGAFTS